MKINFDGGEGSGTTNISNNYIYDVRAPRSTSIPGVIGIEILSALNNLSANVYYNTILLDNTVPPTITNHSSSAVYFSNFSTSAFDFRNNILVNKMSAGTSPTTGRAAVLFTSNNSNLLRLASTTNNNLYWVGTPSIAKPLVYDSTTSYTTLSSYQSAIATGGLGGPRELQSITENPPFINSVSPYNLHINTAIATLTESGGLPITGLTSDYDGNTRNTNFPDIGADEFSGILAADVVPPSIVFTDLTKTSLTSNRILTVKIKDLGGIGSGGNLPRLYYKKSTDAGFVFDDNPSISSDDYTFTINYSLVGGGSVSLGDVIQYYVAAQDIAGTPNLSTNPTGGSGTNPPGTTAPSSVKSYCIIGAPLTGTYSVGLTLFNRVIGKQLVPQTFSIVVKEKIRAKRNLKSINIVASDPTVMKDIEQVPGYDMAFSFDTLEYSPSEFATEDVVKEFTVLMENGKVYNGPQFLNITKEQLAGFGLDTNGFENIEGIYSTLTAAINDLNLRGVSGAVTLSLVDNNYIAETYPIDINSVSGVNSSNTITIKPSSGISPVFTNAKAQLKITNTSYVMIDGSNSGGTDRSLTINRQTEAGNGIWVSSVGTTPVTNITIKNCKIYTGEVTASTPVMVSDGSISGNAGYFSNIVVQNNDLRKCRQAIYINGGTVPQNASNVSVLNNLVGINALSGDSVKLYGIYVQGVNGCTIRNNYVAKFESVTVENDRGIWLASGTTNSVVERNRVHDLKNIGLSSGSNGIVVSSSLANSNNIIKNNFIYAIGGTGSNTINLNPLGIFIFGNQSGIGIYNNSIYLSGALLSSASAIPSFSCGILLSTLSFADVKNNIVYNSLGNNGITSSSNTNGAIGVSAFSSLNQFTSLSNNVYYINPTIGRKSFGFIWSSGLGFNQTLTSWQINSGKDVNSLNGDPQYIDPINGDLHIKTTLGTPCESGAIAGLVTDDIDGELRNPGTPDIGADEFNGTKYSLTLTALIEGFYNSLTGKMIPDTLRIYLRNISFPYTIIDSAITKLDSTGLGTFKFNNVVIGTSYYLKLSHRNSIETWSKNGGENFNLYAFSYDFTTAVTQAYGSNMQQKGTKWCIYGGDVTSSTPGVQDGLVDGSDLAAVDNDNSNFITGYVVTDVTGDDLVDGSDLALVDNNNTAFVGKAVPPGALNLKEIRKLFIRDEIGMPVNDLKK